MNCVKFDKCAYSYIYFKQEGPSLLDFFLHTNHNNYWHNKKNWKFRCSLVICSGQPKICKFYLVALFMGQCK